ncbi:MAG TPA: SUMF1/EgtB/PvdO family nonheme iron enzyme [Prolixibacteraceae bacterium]|nr:SUMF1/EgtB/PvdO family nonheme iron enzyme [Prolixibacteraceae bacterium]
MNKLTKTIKKLISERGFGILEQEKRLIAILADLHPEDKRNRYLIGLSLRADIPRKLLSLNNDDVTDNDHKINSIKHFFKEEFFLEEGAVRLVFDCWIEAIKLTPEFFTENVNAVNFNMIAIKGGTFLMGSNEYDDEKPLHSVTVSDFFMAETQVTRVLWKAIMSSKQYDRKGDNLPVDYLSWGDAQDFISKLNVKTGKTYRLPTEAEWEYAAGGGETNRTIWAGTNDENKKHNYAWYDPQSNGTFHPVGIKQPNPLGLYDIGGNVWEWCSDWYSADYYANSPQNNPKGASTGHSRVFRGGDGYPDASFCRVAIRGRTAPGNRCYYLGFRLALVP